MPREPELGIKVKVEPQLKQEDIVKAINESTPDKGFGINVKVTNVAQAMKEFTSAQAKDNSLWPLINVKIGNAKQALDTAFGNASINVNIQSTNIDKIKQDLQNALSNISVNVDTTKAVKTVQEEIKKTASSSKSGITTSDQKLLTQYENSLKRLFSLREKISKVEDPNSGENAVLQKKYIDELTTSHELYNNILKNGLENTDKVIKATSKYSDLVKSLAIQEQAIGKAESENNKYLDNSKKIKEYEDSLSELFSYQEKMWKSGNKNNPDEVLNAKYIESASRAEKAYTEIKKSGLETDEKVVTANEKYYNLIDSLDKKNTSFAESESKKFNEKKIQEYISSLETLKKIQEQIGKVDPNKYDENILLLKKDSNSQIQSQKLLNELKEKGLDTDKRVLDAQKEYQSYLWYINEQKYNIQKNKDQKNSEVENSKLIKDYVDSLKSLSSSQQKVIGIDQNDYDKNLVLLKKNSDEQIYSQRLLDELKKKGLDTDEKVIAAQKEYNEYLEIAKKQQQAIQDSKNKKSNDKSDSKLISEYEKSLKSLSASDKKISKIDSREYDTNAVIVNENLEKAIKSQQLLEEIKKRGLDSDERVLEIQRQYETTLSAILKQQDSINKKKSEETELSENVKLLNSYQQSLEKIVNLRNRLSKKSSSEDGSNALLNKNLIDEQIESEKLKDQIYQKGLNTTDQYSKIEKDYATSISAVVEQEKARQKAESESTKTTRDDITALEKKIGALNNFKNKLKKNNLGGSIQIDQIDQVVTYSNRLEQLLSLYGDRNIAAQKFGMEFDITGINTYKDAVDYIENRVSQIRNEVNDILDKKSLDKVKTQSETALSNLTSTVRDYYNKNTNIIGSSLDSPFEKLMEDLKAPGASNNVVELRNRFSELRTATKELGLETDTLLDKFKNLFSQHFSTMITMEALHLIEQSLQVIYQNVVDIDHAMTELKKVTDETASGYEQFMDRASDSATKLGVSISDYINSTADWARLGYSLPDAEEMAEMSTLLSNVGDGISSASQAGEYLISIMQGFGYAADDAEKIVDMMNEVANTQPIDAYGISEILTRSAAAMNAANNSLEETIALGTAANAVVQDPEKVGNALKSISLFLRAAKTDAEAAGIAVDGMANSVSELREDVKSIAGVDIMADTAGTQFKSTYDILKEISEVWDNLTDVDQANLTEMLAGKYNANILSALLNDFSVAESTMESAADSAGSAWEENEVYLDSIQGRISQLNASFQELSVTILDGDLIKGLVSLATGFVKVANSIVKLTGVIPILATAFSTYFAINNFQKPVSDIMSLMSETGEGINDLIDNVIKSGKKLANLPLFSIKPLQTYGIEKLDLSGFSVDSSELQNFISQLSGLDDSQKSATLSLTNLTSSQQDYINETLQSISAGEKLSGSMYSQALSTDLFDESQKNNLLTQLNLIDANGNYLVSNTETVKSLLENANVTKTLSNEQKNAASAALTNTVALQAQTAATGAVTVAQSALNKVLVIGKQLLFGFAVGAVVLIIQKIASAISDWYKTQDELNEIMDTSVSNLKSVKQNLESLSSQLEDVLNKINEIKNSGPLTFKSKEELDSLNQQKENLKMQIELEKLKQENANREAEKDANQAYEEYAEDNDVKLDTNQIDTSVANMGTGALVIAADTNNSINSTIAAYESLKQARDAAYGNPEEYQRYDAQLSDITDQLRDQAEELTKYKDNFDEIGYDNLGEEAKENYDDISEALEYILVLLGQISVIDLPKFDGAKQFLQNLYLNDFGGSKEKLVEYLNNVNNLTPAVKTFVDAVIDAGGTSEEIANSIAADANDVGNSISQTITTLEEQNEKLDELQSAYSTVRGAIDEYNQQGLLSADTLQALSQLSPQYTQCLFDEDGQLNINSETLSNVRTRYIELAGAIYDNIKALQIKHALEQIEGLTSASQAASLWKEQNALESLTEQYGDYSILYEARQKKLLEMQSDPGFYQYLSDADKYITDLIKGAETSGKLLDQAKENLKNNTDEALNYTPKKQTQNTPKAPEAPKKQIADAISAWKSLYEVMDEYNSYGEISYETLGSLIGMDNELTECLVNQDGQLVINIARFRQLVAAQLAESVTSEDAKNNADELARMLQWLDENAQQGTVTLDQFRDIVEGVGTALDDAQDKADRFAGALQPLYELQFDDKKFFTKEDIDNILDGVQELSKIDPNVGSNKFLSGNDSDILFNLNYSAIVEEATKQIEDEIARLDEAKDSAAIALLKATETAIQNGDQSAFDYLMNDDNATLNLVTQKMDTYQQKYQTITKAVEEYNKYHQLSQDTMQELADIVPEYEQYLTFEGKQVKFNTEAFKENYKQMLLDTAATVEAYGGNKELVEWLRKLGNGLENIDFHMGNTIDVIEELKSAFSDLASIMGSALGAMQDQADDRNNDLKIWGQAIQDELQDRIDALEDQKEALKEANDEEERAIKLAQLQDALEKARANKTVRKYVEGKGYIWTVDDEAVKDAEKELSDQQRDWAQEDAEKAIDDQIDAIEDIKDKYQEVMDLIGTSWEDYNKKLQAEAEVQDMTLDEMESDLDNYKDSVVSNMETINNIEIAQETVNKFQDFISFLETAYDLLVRFDTIVKFFNNGEGLDFSGIFGNVQEKAQNIFTGVKNVFSNIVTNVKDTAKNIISAFTGNPSAAWDQIESGAKDLVPGLEETLDPGMPTLFDSITTNIKLKFTDLWTDITTGATGFITNLKNIFKDFNISKIFGNLFNPGGENETDTNTDSGSSGSTGSTESGSNKKWKPSGLLLKILDELNIGAIHDYLENIFKKLNLNDLWGILSTKLGGISNVLSGLFSNINLPNIASAIGSLFTGGGSSILGMLQTAIGTIGTALTSSGGIGGIFASLAGSFGTALTSLTSVVGTGVSGIIGAIGTAIGGGLPGIVIAAVAAVITAIGSANGGDGIIGSFVKGVQTIVSNAWNLVSSIASAIINIGETVFGTIGDLVNGIVTSISNAVTNALNFLNKLADGVKSIWKGITGFITDIYNSTIGKLLNNPIPTGDDTETGSNNSNKNTSGNKKGVVQTVVNTVVSAVTTPIKTAVNVIGSIGKAAGNLIGGLFGLASGTDSVKKSGLYNVDEKGPELIVRKPKFGRYTYLESGDGVIPNDITNRLFEIGADPNSWIRKQLNSIDNSNLISSPNSYSISIGDIIVENPVGDIDDLSKQIIQKLPMRLKQDLSKR